MPGEARWRLLAPLVAHDAPERAEAAGYLYRTPYGWPAAVFDAAASAAVPGQVVTLRDPTRAFPFLDAIEGTGTGLFERRLVTTTAGQCWAYHWPRQTASFQAIKAWSRRDGRSRGR